MTPVAQEILPKTDEKLARNLLSEVDGLLDQARNGRESLQKTYVEIGAALLKVEQTKAWMTGGFHSFEAYIKSCETRFGRARTFLFGAKSVAERLLPSVPKEKLVGMGITKAMSLAQFVRKTNKPVGDLVDKALDPKTDVYEFRAAVAEAQHERLEKGKWFDLGGFFCTPEEKEEIERGFQAAFNQGPLPGDASEWLVRKVVVQRLVMEFLSTYPDEQGLPKVQRG